MVPHEAYGALTPRLRYESVDSDKIIPPSDNVIETRICGKKMVYAPVAAGEIYGTIEYMVGDTVLCEDVLVFSEASELDESQVKISFLERLAGFLKGLV